MKKLWVMLLIGSLISGCAVTFKMQLGAEVDEPHKVEDTVQETKDSVDTDF